MTANLTEIDVERRTSESGHTPAPVPVHPVELWALCAFSPHDEYDTNAVEHWIIFAAPIGETDESTLRAIGADRAMALDHKYSTWGLGDLIKVAPDAILKTR